MNELTSIRADEIAEAVFLRGDVSQLKPAERATYITAICKSLGLNPLTRPIEFIKLSGREVPYVKRDGTDQLRKIHGVSVTDCHSEERDGLYIVTAKVQDRDGRTDVATGVLPIKGAQGEARANLIMKCETKAKRRATLSICGLGWMDESELETIPEARKAAPKPAANVLIEPPHDPETGEVRDDIPPALDRRPKNGNTAPGLDFPTKAREAAIKGRKVWEPFYRSLSDEQKRQVMAMQEELQPILEREESRA